MSLHATKDVTIGPEPKHADNTTEINEKQGLGGELGNEVGDAALATYQVSPKRESVSTLRALLWKNFVLKRKRRRSTCCEVLVPAFFLLLIIVLKGLTQIEEIPEGWSEDFVSSCPYTNRATTSALVQVPCPVHYENMDFFDGNFFSFFSAALGRDRRTPFGKLCLSHSGNKREEVALREFVDFVAEQGITETGPFPDIREGVVFFNSERELFDYLKSPTYGLPFSEAAPQCTGALVFNSIDFGTAQFDYTIRGNATLGAVAFQIPATNGDPIDFERNIDKEEVRLYSSRGWFNLQSLVDTYLISRSFELYTEFPMKVAQNSRKAQAERVFFDRAKIRIVAMPIHEFTRDIFFTLVQDILPLVFVVVYLTPVSQIIAVIVLEKEVRAREMMRLMGVSDFKIISSWFVTYIAFFVVISLLFVLGGSLMFPATTAAAGGFSLTIFFIFFSFGLAVLAYSFVISTLFKKAFNAVVFGLMTYVIGFFLFYFFSEEFVVPTGPLLIPQIAFAFTIQTLAIFEETGIGITGALVSTDVLGFNVARGIAMMLFDAFYLTLLGFYLNAVIPGEFGTAWPFYFPLLPKYWRKMFTSSKPDSEFALIPDASELVAIEGDKVEQVNEGLKSQVAAGIGVQIRGMSKVFKTPDGDKVAVDNLNLDIFEGQILVLLGHNGAGKTTTLQMLAGSLFMTRGEAYIYGNRVRTDLGAIRKSLGFCPQHDVLYKELTVYDHLKFYGKIKSISGEDLEKDIDDSLFQVGLTEKKHVKSKNLSGGMKRKLSLAISLIGKSKVIFVDEPTSGVDTFSRRSMWEILQNAREGRVIILTTHFMDEADLLGDRIAIMAEGKLQCVGSSFFLKQTYGAGYRLVFTKKKGCLSNTIEELVRKHVEGAEKTSDVGTELSFHLPVNQSHCFAQLFAEVDELLESGSLLVSNYGISVTTMEEVFLKAGQSDDLIEGAKDLGIAEKSLNGKELMNEATDSGIFESNFISAFLRQFYALLFKRIRYARRDRYAFVCNTLVPVTIFCIGLLVLTYSGAFDDLPPFEMNALSLNPDFPPEQRAFMPVIELSLKDEQELAFNSGRFAQQANFPQFKLEKPVENLTEFPSGIRQVFNRTYLDGSNADCLDPFCSESSPDGRLRDVILDLGQELITPGPQFLNQIEDRKGASLFASAIFSFDIGEVNQAGCFFAEFGLDLATGITIGQQQVECNEQGSPCVMLEVTLDNFFGNDLFTCLPAGCLSDLNQDVLNTLFSFVDVGVDFVDEDFVDNLLTESEVFVCEERLCNLAPASLDEFSICRGGAAFIGDELCVVDDFVALETEFILNEGEDSVEEVIIDIDRNASYCEGKDVSGISIDDFVSTGSSSRLLQSTSVTSCLDSTIREELETLIQLQTDVNSAEAEASFDSRLEECVDEEFTCVASILPLSNETSLCIVDSCIEEAVRAELTEELLGVGIPTQLFLSVLDGLPDVPCTEIAQHCSQTVDYQSAMQVLTALVENDSINTLLESSLLDLVTDIGQDLFNTSAQFPQVPVVATTRSLQSTCSGSALEECNVLRINGICVELTCEEQLELLGFPPGLGVQELIALASLIPDIEVVAAPCADQQLVDELNCTNDIVLSLDSLGLESLLIAIGNGDINTVQDLLQVLDNLDVTQLEALAGLVNGFLNTTLDGAQIDEAISLLNSNFEILESLIVAPELVQEVLAAVLNSRDTTSVNCSSSLNETCVLIELDLNFGLVCLPAGCSSQYFDSNTTREVAGEMDASFNGVTNLFVCAEDDCNTGCQQPSNCESQLFAPVVEDTEALELVVEDSLCIVYRALVTLLLNTTAKHISPIAFGELHTAILRRSLVEYFDFEAVEFDGLDVTFHNNSDKFNSSEAGPIGNPNVEFTFPDEDRAPRIRVTSHPMPFTQSTQEIFEAIIAFTTAIFCLLAYAFIPGPMISYVVMEKEEDVQIKHLQFVSGAGVFAYWTSNYVFDIFAFLIPFFISLLLIKLFDVSSFVDNGAFEVVAIVLFGYGLAIIPFSYLFGHLFKKHTTALIWIIIINCLTGLTLMIASFAMDQVPDTVETNKKLKWLYRFSPGFCMGDSLLNIAVTGLTIGLLGEENSPGFYDRDVAGANIQYLYLEALLFFLIVVFVEFVKSSPVLSKHLSFKSVKTRMFGNKETEGEEGVEIDEDVQAEADRVMERVNQADRSGMSGVESGNKPDVLEMINLRKEYSNGKVAVRGVSLGVPEGECFGYLGINGAGKTTTLKCLTGDIFPTSGNGFISGHSIVSEQWAVRRNIGYCSQFSSILGLLTVREHLELFCHIKQVIDVEDSVHKLLRRLSLSPFENKLAKSLSGGNKRKLSVAIAMIGSPDLMLLDEPSTGMDVASRRFMWNVIEKMVAGKYDGKKTSVVLTTHSMEECEALCSRVGIMVGGRLRCLGSIQHLKSRFGSGYTVEAKLNYITKEEVLAEIEVLGCNVDDRVGMDEFHSLVAKLDSTIAARIEENPNGVAWQAVRNKIENGGIHIKILVEWVLQQKRIAVFEEFLKQSFKGVELVEAHDYKVTYRIEKSTGRRLSNLFEALEGNKEAMQVAEYSVSQTTLEQVFNEFAAQQEEEHRSPRGIVKNQS